MASPKYSAVLTAQSGHLLLGDMPQRMSSWLGTQEQAERWLEVVIKQNDRARRKHDGGRVRYLDHGQVKEVPRAAGV